MKQLHYGDNLKVLRDSIASESIDLIYLDPPFNSSATYNILFKNPTGERSAAQIEAFEDTWEWGSESELLLQQMLFKQGNLARFLDFFVDSLGRNPLSAYLIMMAARLLELHRVLKPTGSLYLHCDPTASHYLKVILDRIFNPRNFRNEIAWCYGSGGASKRHFSRKHDVILFYTKSDNYTFNVDQVREPYSSPHKSMTPKKVGDKSYIKMNPLGRIPFDWWTIPVLTNSAKERLGYPTQKPEALLEKIIRASSSSNDIVLDPFCGCGTAVHAAEKLGRNWIGIDITHLAISLIEKRLYDSFPGIQFDVEGTPTDFDGAKNLASHDKYQFQWWACSLVNAQPYGGKKKGADGGIDGQIFFTDFMGCKSVIQQIIVSVKGGANVTLTMLKDLIATVHHNKAAIGLFITLIPPTRSMVREAAVAGFYRAGNGMEYPKIQILTVEGLLMGKERPEYFDMSLGELTYKKAQRESSAIGTQQELF